MQLTSSQRNLQQLYYQCWRADAPPVEISLEELVPLLEGLLHGGGAGLIWPRIRHRAKEYGAVGEMLEHTYQQYAKAQETIERDIATVVTQLRTAGIAPVLVKGWSISSRYPGPAVRRPGDIDLVVPAETFLEAQRIIRSAATSTGLDLKYDQTSPTLPANHDLPTKDRWKSQPSSNYRQRLDYRQCGDTTVATLSTEDALRTISAHFINHYGGQWPVSSPLWLCDVGILLEQSTAALDWDRVLNQNSGQCRKVVWALVLARDVLGAESPFSEARRAPSWATTALLDAWIKPYPPSIQEVLQRDPFAGLARRIWPDPLNASLRRRGPVQDLHPRSRQVIICLSNVAYYVRRSFYYAWSAVAIR